MNDPHAHAVARSTRGTPFYAVIAALLCAPLVFNLLNSAPAVEPNYCAADAAPDADTLVMLSATWCGYCKKARRTLHAENVKHCEYDVEQSDRGRELYDSSMANGVPVFLYRGHHVYGYDMERVRSMLARR